MRSFVVPHLNYIPYIEKPPLLYWLTALALKLFGANEFGARFVNAVAALAGVIATYFFALHAFDRRRAALAAAILATSVLYAGMAQILTTDMLLTAFITIALFAFFLDWRDGGSWCWLGYGAIGMSILVKGPVGAAIPLLTGGIFLWWRGELWGSLRRFQAIAELLLAPVIALPWFVAISLRQPDFAAFYLVGEHLRRFFDSGYSHTEPIYFYAPVIAGGMLPWTILVPFLPWRSLEPSPARLYCAIAAGTVVTLFSLASAKLIPYVMPAFPPFAVILADAALAVDGAAKADTAKCHGTLGPRPLAICGAILAMTGAFTAVLAPEAARFGNPYPLTMHAVILAAGIVLIAGGSLCGVFFWRGSAAAGLVSIVATAAAIIVIASYGRILAEPTRSHARLARAISQNAPDALLVCYSPYIQSLAFYSRRRVVIVGAEGELAYGAKHSSDAPDWFFDRPADFLGLWREPRRIVVIVDRAALATVERDLGPFTVVASDSKKLAIVRGRDPRWTEWLSGQPPVGPPR